MMEVFKRIAVLVILWAPFSLMCLAAVPVSFAGVLLWSQGYGKNLLGGMDRTGSGLLGLDARYTISAHCGSGEHPWLKPLGFLLDLIQKGHCEGAARNEGLLR